MLMTDCFYGDVEEMFWLLGCDAEPPLWPQASAVNWEER